MGHSCGCGSTRKRRIIAVSYEARKFGVKRGMMIPEAKTKCPELNVCFVPQGEHIDKADIQKYRDASAEVFDVLNAFDQRIIVERASVDEAFLDLTELVDKKILETGALQLLQNITSDLSLTLPATHLADGNDKNSEGAYDREANLRRWLDVRCATEISHLRLAIAAQTIEQMRAKIRERTKFFCSGGVGNNKMLAKLVCARHKPRQQTVIPFDYVPVIFEGTPVGDVRMLGGKLGHKIQDRLAVGTMGDLATIPYEMLELHFGGHAQWISQLAKGHDDEPVKPRNNQLSIAVSKNFPGKNALTTVAEVRRTPPVFNLSMSASRFIGGMSVQSQNIKEWMEKRSQLRDSNAERLQPSSLLPPKSEVFVNELSSRTQVIDVMEGPSTSEGVKSAGNSPQKTSLKEAGDFEVAEVELDDDGWQVYDPSQFEFGTTSNAIPALESSDVGEISSAVFEELPANIKAELAHFHKLNQARKLKAAAIEREKPSRRKGIRKAVTESPPAKRRLEAFFKKDSP
ncbi:ImpB/MucB/SamB family protein [Necator americanus]|uniref:ImpB/MucB/SamB family protein n=1 Tax=Necator americanus TaxID=51031 RepID=W2TH58_NECAM|nr:ImpB/MucB/SamB family protein [Necator americanus]ETN81385.1 ImpB/MucB/SamB family protein [Necator americanus]